jgi:hypothetical protein
MKDIICVNVSKNHIYNCGTRRIGRKGENLSTSFEITLDPDLLDLDVFMEFEKPNGETLATPKLELINNVATYDLPLYLLDTKGELKAQIVLRNTITGKVWKTYIKTYFVEEGICACDDIPEKEDFITEAQKLLDEIKESGGTGGIAKETDPTVPQHVKNITEQDIENWNSLDQVLQDILTIIQGGELDENQIADIEQLIVSYFENKTVREVEE